MRLAANPLLCLSRLIGVIRDLLRHSKGFAANLTFAQFGLKNIEIQDARTWENFSPTFFHHDKQL